MDKKERGTPPLIVLCFAPVPFDTVVAPSPINAKMEEAHCFVKFIEFILCGEREKERVRE